MVFGFKPRFFDERQSDPLSVQAAKSYAQGLRTQSYIANAVLS